MNTPSFLQDLIMFPVHVIEGLSVRYGVFRTLYRMMAPIYGPPRPWYCFGEDLFLGAINPGESVLELGSGTGFLTRQVGEKSGECVGLELEHAMVDRAARKGRATRYVRGMMESIPFKRKSFAKCISLGALHCADPEVVAAAVFHVLKDKGEFLLLTEARIIPRFVPHSGPVVLSLAESGERKRPLGLHSAASRRFTLERWCRHQRDTRVADQHEPEVESPTAREEE